MYYLVADATVEIIVDDGVVESLVLFTDKEDAVLYCDTAGIDHQQIVEVDYE